MPWKTKVLCCFWSRRPTAERLGLWAEQLEGVWVVLSNVSKGKEIKLGISIFLIFFIQMPQMIYLSVFGGLDFQSYVDKTLNTAPVFLQLMYLYHKTVALGSEESFKVKVWVGSNKRKLDKLKLGVEDCVAIMPSCSHVRRGSKWTKER